MLANTERLRRYGYRIDRFDRAFIRKLQEGWGLNVAEANALGVPCVAYNVTGLRDSIRNGETGSLVTSGDIQALAERLIKVLEDKQFKSSSENRWEYSKISVGIR